ncbi:S8 family peptidase [Chishuiella sp.]|uniref:S8 family peptidase n=1 Tax=Chishuiella sp. TaxID=1969467 RepID=UPI0028A60F38|nr:S8 family peptidase [Chishuiella sp.]
MKKKLLTLSFLSLVFGVNAQNKNQLINNFQNKNKKNIEKFNKIVGNPKSAKNTNEYDLSKLSFINKHSIGFLQEDDVRANSTSNVDYLQKGQVGGFSINGENMTIGIFDGGTVLNNHNEFRDKSNQGKFRIVDLENGLQALSAHATSVSGFIAAEGRATLILTSNATGAKDTIVSAAKGVLPLATINHAGFSTTTNGDIFEKILKFNKYISNHSYGINYGWGYNATGTKGAGWYYPINTKGFSSDTQTLSGAYLDNDAAYDEIVYADPKFTIVKSSGNYFGYGPEAGDTTPKFRWGEAGYQEFEAGDIVPKINCFDGSYCIGTGSLAKNIIVVGAIDLPSTNGYRISSSNDIIRSSYSSVGPRKDGAIKPDIVAVGSSVIAPTSSAINSYTIGSGTSYSAPKVTGVIGAITELKRKLTNDNNFYYNSDEVKAILLHTTQEAGDFDGPDNWFGWGLLDAKKAAETVLAIQNNEAIFERNEKESGENYEKEITVNSEDELKVTITWVDPAGDLIDENATLEEMAEETVSKLVNDLDLRIIDLDTNEIHFPWKLDLSNVTGAAVKGDNTVDNIEQISIKTPQIGKKYKIIISNKGTLVDDTRNSSKQTYTLLITGAKGESLATNDVVSKSNLIVYPTLAKDIVNIKTDNTIEKVQLYDISGKLISTTKSNSINVSSLSSGVYIINIKTDKEVVSKKIIKQ